MKRLTILLTLLLVLVAVPVGAQTSITTTTLTNAISSPSVGRQVIVVGANTGMSVGSTFLYIDGAIYQINVISGTSITVTNSARPSTHLANATVYVVPIAAQVGLDPIGSCIRGTTGVAPQYSPYTLLFNSTNGHIAWCGGALGSRTWTIISPYAVQVSTDPPQTP